jgi:hypothetical protein
VVKLSSSQFPAPFGLLVKNHIECLSLTIEILKLLPDVLSVIVQS